jgi:hypothetical protein
MGDGTFSPPASRLKLVTSHSMTTMVRCQGYGITYINKGSVPPSSKRFFLGLATVFSLEVNLSLFVIRMLDHNITRFTNSNPVG